MSEPRACDPYPLLTQPLLLEKVWGGRRLERYGKQLPPDVPIGESWEVADLEATSASGAGGHAARSPIANGPLAGHDLHEALHLWGPALIGESAAARALPFGGGGSNGGGGDGGGGGGGFPLLVKYLDARENLSVQVHPSAAYARAHPGAHLKTEAWYILEACPGSIIYKGLRPGLSRGDFVEHLRAGRAVEALLAVPAIPGDCHLLSSGTCHALGAGVLVAEVQTPSDTTFRLYDWERTGRALHLEQALSCIAFDQTPPPARRRDDGLGGPGCVLASTPFFTVRGGTAEPLPAGRCAVVMMVRGGGRLHLETAEPLPLARGQTVIIPAVLARGCAIEPDPGEETAEWLVMTIS
jgi:mannose-6-phosphate isomerase